MSHALKQRAPPARPPAHPEEARLRALLEQSGEGRWLSDAAGRDLYVSPSLWALLGQSPTDPRTSLLEALPMPARLQLQASHQAALAAPGKPVGVELELQGLHRWVEACLTNHLDHLDLRAVIGTFRDVSAQKVAQADQE
jgi:PAS domain S-box-containing protein